MTLLFSCIPPSLQPFIDSKHPWSALQDLPSLLKQFPLGTIESSIPSHVHIENKESIYIQKNVHIEPGVYIKGPCVIGQGSVIKHCAYIRENTWIANACVIGHSCEVKESLLFEGATIGHMCYVGNSIIGKKVNLGAGVKCANLRLDRKTVCIHFQNQKIDTGLRKFGALVGEDCSVGCNTVLDPGTLLAKGCKCYPCMHIKGTYHSHTLITP